jgi:hypothetical protein
MSGRRCRAPLLGFDAAYNCILLPLFQKPHHDAHLAAVATFAGDHALDVAQDVVVIAVVAKLLHDPRESPLRQAKPFDVPAQLTDFLHRGSPSD